MTHTLYRHYRADGRLLYVGITTDYVRRCSAHSRESDWWTEVASSSEVDGLAHDEAVRMERETIATERPLHNRQGRTPTASGGVGGINAAVGAVVADASAGLGRAGLSRCTGIPLTSLNRRLAGSSPFDVMQLAAVAGAIGMSVSQIFAAAEQGEQVPA